jgi:cytochrome P450
MIRLLLTIYYQTVSANYTFFLFMTLHPEVQAKAQAEIDAVVGRDRLPTFSDRPQLPYVRAVVSEVLRCGLVVPMPPRRARVDDVYGGYLIPKDSIILQNTWCVRIQRQ